MLDTCNADNRLYGAVPFARLMIKNLVKLGDIAVDATCGNGNDTLLLAQLTGDDGKVYAFDIQEQAINATKELLESEKLLHRVTLIKSGHELLCKHLSDNPAVVVFNLGYLPGGEKSITTESDTTKSGIEQALRIIRIGGAVIITAYPGHDTGAAEASNIRNFVAQLPQQQFHVWETQQPNCSSAAPFNILIQKVQKTDD